MDALYARPRLVAIDDALDADRRDLDATQRHDRNTRKAFYERIGVESCWRLDPAEPGALTAFALCDGRYEQVTHVAGDEPYTAEQPFPVTVVPARLLDGTRP